MDSILLSLQSSRYRSRADIIADILTVVQNGASKTQIMEKANLNFRRFDVYMEELTKLGLIEVSHLGKVRIYTLSQKGMQFLTQYNTLVSLMK